jgi:hypothetical protein
MLHLTLLGRDCVFVALLNRPLLKDSHVVDDSRIFFIIGVNPCLIERRDHIEN